MNLIDGRIVDRASARLGCLLLVLLVPTLAPAQATDTAQPTDFKAFSIITERNIFNPNRSSRPAPVTRPTGRSPEVETITLVGTLGQEHDWLAFFNSPNAQYRGQLQARDTIANHTITRISNEGVQLQQGTNSPFNLRVGMQLRRQDDGPWELTARSEIPDHTQSPRVSSAATPAKTDGVDNDVLMRLMQKREQELQ